ncbi:MAG: Omp28-related outer membrane protein [Crocinitomicaceae bacterium]
MKKSISYILFILTVAPLFMTSCDKVEFPNIPIEGVDTSLYPGNFSEYTIPSFSENSNPLKNVLIEEFTGHLCGACPNAAVVAKTLEEENPGRVFAAAIHGGPSNNGLTGFHNIIPPKYDTDHTNEQGLELASTFFQLGIGFVALPRGGINRRVNESGEFMFGPDDWAPLVAAELAEPVKINLQAKSNYYEETNGVYLHVETDFEQSIEGTYNVVAYAIQNDRVDYQYFNAYGDSAYYHHHNVHVGNIFGETWGRTVGSDVIAAGTKVVTDMSYKLPDGLTNEDMHFLILVYNRNTYKVEQVIKHEF